SGRRRSGRADDAHARVVEQHVGLGLGGGADGRKGGQAREGGRDERGGGREARLDGRPGHGLLASGRHLTSRRSAAAGWRRGRAPDTLTRSRENARTPWSIDGWGRRGSRSRASGSAAATSAASARCPSSTARATTKRRPSASWTRPGTRASTSSTPPTPTGAAGARATSGGG